MRKFLIALALLLGIIFIIGNIAEVQNIIDTLKIGDWRFILIAFGVELIWLLNVAISYKAIYRSLGLEEKTWTLILIAAGSIFVNIAAPTAGMSGVAVFVSEAKRRNYSSARATLAGVLYVLFDYTGFLCVLAVGLLILIRRNDLNAPELIASAILVTLATGIAILLYQGMRSANALGRALTWLAHQTNRLLHPIIRRDYLSEQRALEFAHDGTEGLSKIRQNPYNLVIPIALALSSKSLLIIILFMMFLAFKVPVSPGTLIAAFSISYLFLIVSPTPSGMGFVEGALTLALGSMSVPLGPAAVITLAYRGITFWVPLALGGIALRILNR
jgi:uncharacterized protein (TIRG00374 family)